MAKKTEGPAMKDLISAAKDLNKVLILEPELPTKVGTKKSVLMDEINEAKELIGDDDISKFEDNTISVLTEMGIIEAENTDDEETEVEEPVTEKKPTKKTPPKKDKKPAAKKGKKEPGVIASVSEFISKKPMNKDSIVKALAKRFPNREIPGLKRFKESSVNE